MNAPAADIVVAVSGGLDSSMAAVLLQEQGWRVQAVFLRLTADHRVPRDLRDLAARRGFSLTVIDLTREFRARVIGDFLQAYRRGRTPNPCVRCNAAIKFGCLWDLARSWGVSHLATGHYARLVSLPSGDPALLRGVDPVKDQSYFLHRLPRTVLPHVVLPLGGFTKAQVAALARQRGLAGALQTSESQDICFIPRGDYREFLRQHPGSGLDQPGDIVDRRGRVLGRHRGLENYTVGQRRGLGLPAAQPYYVLVLDPAANRLLVGFREELYAPGLVVADLTWLADPPPEPFTARVHLRHRHPGVDCQVILLPRHQGRVVFATPQTAVTPGQAAVFYQDERLLGGGWIEAPLP